MNAQKNSLNRVEKALLIKRAAKNKRILLTDAGIAHLDGIIEKTGVMLNGRN